MVYMSALKRIALVSRDTRRLVSYRRMMRVVPGRVLVPSLVAMRVDETLPVVAMILSYESVTSRLRQLYRRVLANARMIRSLFLLTPGA